MSKEHEAIVKGVTDAWDFWLSQHDVSTPELIQAGVEEAVADWLRAHLDPAEVTTAIARAVAEGMS